MPFKPLVTAGIESLLNTFLYRSPALKTANARLMYWANGQAMLTAPLSPTPVCCRNFAIASSLPH